MELPAPLSTKAIFLPSTESAGEFRILPAATVDVLYANNTVGAEPQSPLGEPE
jgi:hypothetical protein